VSVVPEMMLTRMWEGNAESTLVVPVRNDTARNCPGLDGVKVGPGRDARRRSTTDFRFGRSPHFPCGNRGRSG
jgi:hypothetical protein